MREDQNYRVIGENDLIREEEEIEEEARGLRRYHNITNEVPSWCNSVLQTYCVREGNVLILKCSEEYFLRTKRVLNVEVEKDLQLDLVWDPIHVSNLQPRLRARKVFWKITTREEFDYFGLYVGNLTTFRYSKDEDLVVFVKREDRRERYRTGGRDRTSQQPGRPGQAPSNRQARAGAVVAPVAGPVVPMPRAVGGEQGRAGDAWPPSGAPVASPTPSEEQFMMDQLASAVENVEIDQGEGDYEKEKPANFEI